MKVLEKGLGHRDRQLTWWRCWSQYSPQTVKTYPLSNHVSRVGQLSLQCIHSRGDVSILHSDMRMNLVGRSAEGLSHLSTSKLILLLLALAHTCMLPCFYKPPFTSPLTHSCQLTWEQLYSAPKSCQRENRVLWTLSIKKIQGQEVISLWKIEIKNKYCYNIVHTKHNSPQILLCPLSQHTEPRVHHGENIHSFLCPCLFISLGGYWECLGPNQPCPF